MTAAAWRARRPARCFRVRAAASGRRGRSGSGSGSGSGSRARPANRSPYADSRWLPVPVAAPPPRCCCSSSRCYCYCCYCCCCCCRCCPPWPAHTFCPCSGRAWLASEAPLAPKSAPPLASTHRPHLLLQLTGLLNALTNSSSMLEPSPSPSPSPSLSWSWP